MVPDETSDLPTTLPEASFLNPNRKVPSEARSLRGLFPVPVFAEFPSYSLSKNADGFLQNPFWLSYCNLRKLKMVRLRRKLFSKIFKKQLTDIVRHSILKLVKANQTKKHIHTGKCRIPYFLPHWLAYTN